MSTSFSARITRTPHLGARRLRVLATGGAVLAGLAVWVVAEAGLATDLRQPAFASGELPQPLGAPLVATTSAAGAVLGWLLLAALERLTPRARTVWTVIATVGLLVSLGGPLSGHGIGAANRLILVVMHLAVGAVVIPLLYRSSRPRAARGG